MTKKTYAQTCLERRELDDPLEFFAHARTDVPELARRLERALEVVCILYERYADQRLNWVEREIFELEALPKGDEE